MLTHKNLYRRKMFVGNCGKFVQNQPKIASRQLAFKHRNNLIFNVLESTSREVWKVVDKWKTTGTMKKIIRLHRSYRCIVPTVKKGALSEKTSLLQ